MLLAKSDITLEQRLSQYLSLKNRIELLINIIDDSAGDCQKADEAEMRGIEALRQMGSEALHAGRNTRYRKRQRILTACSGRTGPFLEADTIEAQSTPVRAC